MILVDDRVGSKELLPLFPHNMATLTRLEYADLAFTGCGPDGVPYNIGVERKTIRDLVNSMISGRLSGHQLPGLLNSYHVVYLVVEGIYRPGDDGALELWGRSGWYTLTPVVMYDAVINFCNTLAVVTWVHVFQTGTDRETVKLVRALERWWEKEYEKHSSHIRSRTPETVYLFKPTFKQTVAASLPGIGTEKAKAVCVAFPTVEAMATAEVGDWVKVPGVGKGIAEKVVKAFQQ